MSSRAADLTSSHCMYPIARSTGSIEGRAAGMSSFWTSAGLLILGAAISFVPTFLGDWQRQRAALATRWDVPLQSQCGELLASAQRLGDLASRSPVRPDGADLRRR